MQADIISALRKGRPELVAIGASAGALEALGALLPPLPVALPVPVVVVVHVPPDRPNVLSAHFASISALPVLEVEDKMPLKSGYLYVAPSDYHLLVERGLTAALSSDAPVCYSRPSIDVLFESVADACGPHALGILLSGANADGAQGLARMRNVGAMTWVQQPETAAMPVMPQAALDLAPHPTLPPDVMGRSLAAWGHRHA
jgi:two-component system chemotaxis response regulator CheB